MSYQDQTTCDRCGIKIEADYPRYKFMARYRKLKITKICSSNPYDYWDTENDLCPKCHDDFEKWLRQKAEY
ncbi:MAG: hypothetical protein WA125_16640 [Desulfosporosinus sp.]